MRELRIEEAQELLVHDGVPKEAGIPKDSEPVPRDDNSGHEAEPERYVESAQAETKGPGTEIAGSDLGHDDHATRQQQSEEALVEQADADGCPECDGPHQPPTPAEADVAIERHGDGEDEQHVRAQEPCLHEEPEARREDRGGRDTCHISEEFGPE